MLKVGLTGNIASGKSSVARIWAALGAAVIDADQLARRAVEPGTATLSRIVERWGAGVLDAEGRLDRAALREIVFRDPAERERLEAIVHPAVAALRAEEYRVARDRGETVVVADIPLLFEVGLQHEFDLIVLVDAPESVRLARIVEGRGLSKQEANRMISAQMPAARKGAAADIVIDNSGSLVELESRATEVWRAIQRRALEGESHARA